MLYILLLFCSTTLVTWERCFDVVNKRKQNHLHHAEDFVYDKQFIVTCNLIYKENSYTVAQSKRNLVFFPLFRHMVMYSRILHIKVNGSSIAVLSRPDCDRAMKDCEFSEKGKIDALLWASVGVFEGLCALS